MLEQSRGLIPNSSVLKLLQFGKAATLLVIVVATITGCHPKNRAAERIAQDSAAAQDIQSDLAFNNITLQQADEKGRTIWSVHADRAVYSQDKATAQVQNPNGQLFQDGKLIFRIKARRGVVQQDGQKILLRGQVMAVDTRSGAVLQGDELQWLPKQGILTIRNNLKSSHPQVKLSAREGQMFTRDQRLQLQGQVVAISSNPDVQLRSQGLTWNVREQTLVSSGPIQIDRLINNQITDTAKGDRASYNVKTKIATLSQNAQLNLAEPPMQVSSNNLVWNLNNQTVVSNQPITAFHREQQVTANADRGQVDLKKRVFFLNQSVQIVAQRNQSRLTSDRLTWEVPTQRFWADGNVRYRQVNPVVNVQGPKAFGRLANQTIVLSGGRVITEIIPPEGTVQ